MLVGARVISGRPRCGVAGLPEGSMVGGGKRRVPGVDRWDVLAALGRQEVGRVRGRVALGYGPGAREGQVRFTGGVVASAGARDNTGRCGAGHLGRLLLGRRDTGSLPYRRVGCRRLERREAERRQWAGTSWPRYGGPAPGVGLLVYPGVKQRGKPANARGRPRAGRGEKVG